MPFREPLSIVASLECGCLAESSLNVVYSGMQDLLLCYYDSENFS